MRISYKGWFVFSQPLRLLVALSGFVVAAIGTAPRRATVIAKILVINVFLFLQSLRLSVRWRFGPVVMLLSMRLDVSAKLLYVKPHAS